MEKLDYMKYDGRIEEPPYDTEAAPSSCTVNSIVRWQHEETGTICELPNGKNPGRRWYKIKPANDKTQGRLPQKENHE